MELLCEDCKAKEDKKNEGTYKREDYVDDNQLV